MKKIINLFLILAICQNVALAKGFTNGFSLIKKKDETAQKVKAEKPKKEKIKKEKIGASDKQTEIQIVKPEKEKKLNAKKEKKKQDSNNISKSKSSKEAQGMYETKFPKITSKIDFMDTSEGVSLDDCIKLAISNHPSIMSAISNAEIYKTHIGQAWANYFPTVGAGINYSRTNSLVTSNLMSDKTNNMYYMPTLSADMLLFDFGKTKAAADMAKRAYESSRYDAEVEIEYVIYNVKNAYYNMLFADAQKFVYEDTVKSYELQLKQAKAFFNIGKKAKIDVTTAEYNLGNAKVNLIKAKNTLELASVQLANSVGIPELERVVLKDKLNTKKYDVNFNDLIQTARVSRPSLLSAKKKMDSAELNVRSIRREYSPNINAFGDYYRGGVKMDSDDGFQAGIQLSYNNFNVLSIKKQLDEAKANYKKNVADYELEKQKVYLEVKSAFINLQNSYDSFVVARLALQQAKEQQYQAYRRYQVGLGNAIEFKDAQNTYLNAQLNYYSNLLDYNINAAELERVVGAPIKETDVDL